MKVSLQSSRRTTNDSSGGATLSSNLYRSEASSSVLRAGWAAGLVSAVLLLMAAPVLAADEVDFKPSGEFRVRYFNDLNSTGYPKGTSPGTGQRADSTARLMTNLMARKGETLQVFGSFIYNLQFGAENSYQGEGGSSATSNVVENNSILVNRAWGLWKVTNSVTAKIGRLPLAFGDGTVFSENPWERIPTSHDGFDILWDVESVKLRLIGVKTHEYGLLSNLGSGGSGPVSSVSNDPERNFYGVSMDVRNLPEFVKSANLHAFQVVSDAIADSTSSRGRDNWEHYGVSLIGDFRNFAYRISGAYQTGHIGVIQADSSNTAQNLSANMMDVELSYTTPDWLGFKVAIGGHRDSGSDHADVNRTYQPLYYDRHSYSGLMDVVGWGNLTYGDLILSIAPREDFEMGLGTYMFSRTQNATSASFGSRYSNLTTSQSNGEFAGARSILGTEIDLFASRTFEGSFKMDAHAALFVPGAYLRDGSSSHHQTLAQVMLQGTLPF